MTGIEETLHVVAQFAGAPKAIGDGFRNRRLLRCAAG
jgi:hypothetical protein